MTSRVANYATVRMRRASLRDLPVDTLGDGVVVRPIDHSEEPLRAELLDQAYDDEPWNVDRVRAELIDDPSVATVFLVAGPAGLVATASVQFKPAFSDSGWVHWVATDPAHRRRGSARWSSCACSKRSPAPGAGMRCSTLRSIGFPQSGCI